MAKPFLRGPFSQFKPFRELSYFFCREKLENKYLVVSRRDIEVYILVDTSDIYGVGVLKRGRIETPEDEFIKKLVKPSWVILDIGAHWGGMASALWTPLRGRGKGLLL